MIVAGLVTILFHRFKQPVVLGYIIAGVIIGPHTPPFPLINDKEAIDTLSELGVILLTPSIGAIRVWLSDFFPPSKYLLTLRQPLNNVPSYQ